jgi:hypothetical protein
MALPANKLATKLAEGLSRAVHTLSAGDEVHLKMEKTGDWVFGSDEIEVEPESTWAIDPESLVRGFVAWGNSEVLGEEMASILAEPIIQSDLPDVGAKWGTQVGFSLKCLDGEHEGTVASYKASSRGAQKAFKALVQEILKRAQASETDLLPVVVLESESYKHKTYGKIYNPILSIDEWVSMDDIADVAAPEPEPVVEKEPEPEPEVKPKRRRRRKATA